MKTKPNWELILILLSIGATLIGGGIYLGQLNAKVNALEAAKDFKALKDETIKDVKKEIEVLKTAAKPSESAPIGTIVAWPGEITAEKPLPPGWMLCDGKELSSIGNEKIFAVIGTSWGGTQNAFNLPDLRGVFLRGLDSGAGKDPDAKSRTVGSSQQSAIADHKHNIEHTHAAGDLRTAGGRNPGTGEMVFQVRGREDIGGMNFLIYPRDSREGGQGTAVQPIAIVGTTSSSSVNFSGGPENQTGESRPINVAVNYIIKVK